MFKKIIIEPFLFPFQLLVAKSIVPAFSLFRVPKGIKKIRKSFQEIGGERVGITSADGTVIDAMFFPGERSDKVILFAPGNGEFYEFNGRRLIFLLKSGASVLMFNPRGVGDSQGFPHAKGLSEDIVALYEYLIWNRGIALEDILLYGRSLGGGYGALGAAMVQKKYPHQRVHIISERSFSSLPEGIFHLMGGGMLGKLLAFIARKMGWTLDAKKAWEEIKGEKAIIFHKQDRVIPYKGQIHASVEELDQVRCIEITDPEKQYGIEYCHNRPFTLQEEEQIHDSLRVILKI